MKTGARARALAELLAKGGLGATMPPRAPRLAGVAPELADDLWSLFEALGGQVATGVPRPGSWDLAVDGDVVIELDEELHFNRYRARTLEAAWAARLPWTREYLTFCAGNEGDCLRSGRWGARWTSASCERMFGIGDPPGTFGLGGSPRWKQRAFYDALKDAFALSSADLRLARVSTHDRVGDVTLGEALEGRRLIDVGALVELVRRRSTVARE